MENIETEYYFKIDLAKGLCDRIVGLSEAWSVARSKGSKLNVYEQKNIYCGLSLLDIFENLDDSIKIHDINKCQPSASMELISTKGLYLHKESKKLINYLFQNFLKENIKNVLNFNIPINTFGIHIRAGDQILTGEHSSEPSRVAFENQIESNKIIDDFLENEIKNNQSFLNCNSVFICSSSLLFEQYLIKKIDKKIITNEKKCHKFTKKKGMSTIRGTEEGMIEALIDLVCLSQCINSVSKSTWADGNYESRFHDLSRMLTIFNKNDI